MHGATTDSELLRYLHKRQRQYAGRPPRPSMAPTTWGPFSLVAALVSSCAPLVGIIRLLGKRACHPLGTLRVKT
jgi:hypothetical protein